MRQEVLRREISLQGVFNREGRLFPAGSYRRPHLYVDAGGAGMETLMLEAVSGPLEEGPPGPLALIDFGGDVPEQVKALMHGGRFAGRPAVLFGCSWGLSGWRCLRPLASLAFRSDFRHFLATGGMVVLSAGRRIGGVELELLDVLKQLPAGVVLVLANVQNLARDGRSLQILYRLVGAARERGAPLLIGTKSLSSLDQKMYGLSGQLLEKAGALALFRPDGLDAALLERRLASLGVSRDDLLSLPEGMCYVQSPEDDAFVNS